MTTPKVCAECGREQGVHPNERWAEVKMPLGVVYNIGSAVCLLRYKVRLMDIVNTMDKQLAAMLKPEPVYEDAPVPGGERLA
jgi:hypothetical protein